ncbi:MAG: TonB C-terminal domain-containing protein [Nitrospiria bacterium]
MQPSLDPQHPHFSTMVILSLAIHAIVLSTFFYYKGSLNRPLASPIYTVALVYDVPGSRVVALKERERLRAEETSLRKAFEKVSEETGPIKTDALQRLIGGVERQQGFRKQEDKVRAIKRAFKKIRGKNLFEGEIGLVPEQAGFQPERKIQVTNQDPEIIERTPMERMTSRKAEIQMAFTEPKEREETREEEIKKILQEGKEIKIPAYEPQKWDVTLKEKGNLLTARVKRGTAHGDIANTIANIIAKQITAAWTLDEFASRRADYASLKSIVTIRVGRDGKILEIIIEQKSKNTAFHQSVLTAIKKSDPLPLKKLDIKESFEVGLIFAPMKQSG